MIFISLEMTSLCLYVMTAFNKQNAQSAEAALKYFLFGGTAAAVMLFGLSLIYGVAHSTNLREIATALGGQRPEPVFYLALVMTVVGLGFKVAAVPLKESPSTRPVWFGTVVLLEYCHKVQGDQGPKLLGEPLCGSGVVGQTAIQGIYFATVLLK